MRSIVMIRVHVCTTRTRRTRRNGACDVARRYWQSRTTTDELDASSHQYFINI